MGKWITTFFLGTLRLVRYFIFFVLFALRPIIVAIGFFCVPICMLCGIAYGLLRGWSSTPCLALLGTGVAIAILVFLFDVVLVRIGPDGLDLYS